MFLLIISCMSETLTTLSLPQRQCTSCNSEEILLLKVLTTSEETVSAALSWTFHFEGVHDAFKIWTLDICGIVLRNKTAQSVTSPKHTCTLIMLFNKLFDMSYLSGRWIILSVEKCSHWNVCSEKKFEIFDPKIWGFCWV